MKKIVLATVTVITATILIWFGASIIEIGLHNPNEPANYCDWNACALVSKISAEKDVSDEIITREANGTIIAKGVVITEDGNMWTFFDEDEHPQEVTVIFNTKNTEFIEDDEIIGFWER